MRDIIFGQVDYSTLVLFLLNLCFSFNLSESTRKFQEEMVRCRETDISTTRGWESTLDVIAAKKSSNVVADDLTLVTRRSFDAGGRFRHLPDQELPDWRCL